DRSNRSNRGDSADHLESGHDGEVGALSVGLSCRPLSSSQGQRLSVKRRNCLERAPLGTRCVERDGSRDGNRGWTPDYRQLGAEPGAVLGGTRGRRRDVRGSHSFSFEIVSTPTGYSRQYLLLPVEQTPAGSELVFRPTRDNAGQRRDGH